MDPRLDRLERLVDRVQEQINQLHSSSMQLVTTAFSEMERRLSEKTDKQTAEISAELRELRNQVVSKSDHERLRGRVDELWNRDLGARNEWEEMVRRVPILWDERTRIRAALAVLTALEVGAGIAAGIWTALHH